MRIKVVECILNTLKSQIPCVLDALHIPCIRSTLMDLFDILPLNKQIRLHAPDVESTSSSHGVCQPEARVGVWPTSV